MKFDPNKRKPRRKTPDSRNRQKLRLAFRKASPVVAIVLLALTIGLGVFWFLENRGADPGPATPAGRQAPARSSGLITGAATVIDGDTIEIDEQRIRLDGYDAPESGSMCGRTNVYQKASSALSDAIGTRTVNCEIKGKDRYERYIADCEVGGLNLAEHMVREGWARDWPKYSRGAFADEERRARKAGKGIWGLECPADLWSNRDYD